MSTTIAVIVSRPRNGQPDQQKLHEGLVRRLASLPNVELTVLPHLYDLAPDGPGVGRLKSIDGDMVVLGWLYSRSAYWVLDANGVKGRFGEIPTTSDGGLESSSVPSDAVDGPDRTIWCLDLRNHDRTESYVEAIRQIMGLEGMPAGGQAGRSTAGQAAVVEESTRPRWYPVIDRSCCTNCLECLNFCLFGVFDLDASDSIKIVDPDACRPGCPACSRICPAGAIMFPQHEDPAIAGDPEASLQGLKLDLSQIFGAVDPTKLATTERDRALVKKRQQEGASADVKGDRPAEKDDLDRLIDEVDDLSL